MCKSREVLTLLGLVGIALAQEVQLPNPVEIERQRIERKYDARTPELERGMRLEQHRQEPRVLYQYKFEYKPPERGQLIRGERIVREQQERRLNENGVEVVQGRGQNNGTTKQEVRLKGFKGYCAIDRTYEVSLEEVYVQSECLLNNKPAKAEIVLIPDINQFRLVGKVLSVNGKEVKESVVRTADRTSFNIADEIDRRLISNILLASSRETARTVSSSLEELMRDAGRTVYQGVLGNTIGSTDLEKGIKGILKATPYLAMANILRSSSEEVLGDKKRLPPLFKVKRKDVYVEVVISD